MTLAHADLNPRFVFFSPARTALTDKQQFLEHVDHAIIALDGCAPTAGDCCVELLNLLDAAATLRVDLWVNALDDYTCTYGFTVSSENGSIPYARGERMVVNVDRTSHKPTKWTSDFRLSHADLLKDLPAYA